METSIAQLPLEGCSLYSTYSLDCQFFLMPSQRLLKLWEQDQGKYHAFCVMKYLFAVSDDTLLAVQASKTALAEKRTL